MCERIGCFQLTFSLSQIPNDHGIKAKIYPTNKIRWAEGIQLLVLCYPLGERRFLPWLWTPTKNRCSVNFSIKNLKIAFLHNYHVIEFQYIIELWTKALFILYCDYLSNFPIKIERAKRFQMIKLLFINFFTVQIQ